LLLSENNFRWQFQLQLEEHSKSTKLKLIAIRANKIRLEENRSARLDAQREELRKNLIADGPISYAENVATPASSFAEWSVGAESEKQVGKQGQRQ